MPDTKKNVFVFCEDEEPIYSVYLKIARQLGLKTGRAPTDPNTLDKMPLEDGQVFLFKDFLDSDKGISTLLHRSDCRIVMLVTDQVLDPKTPTYVAQRGRFGSALVETYHRELSQAKTKIVLRTAEDGDITHVFEGLGSYFPDLTYILKKADPNYKNLIDEMLPQIARATGVPFDTVKTKASCIEASQHGVLTP
jgi:hypothetical protein